jgi:hypothetical protein
MRNELKNKAKIIVPTALFLVNNSAEENSERIKWLQDNSKFTKGGLEFDVSLYVLTSCDVSTYMLPLTRCQKKEWKSRIVLVLTLNSLMVPV